MEARIKKRFVVESFCDEHVYGLIQEVTDFHNIWLLSLNPYVNYWEYPPRAVRYYELYPVLFIDDERKVELKNWEFAI